MPEVRAASDAVGEDALVAKISRSGTVRYERPESTYHLRGLPRSGVRGRSPPGGAWGLHPPRKMTKRARPMLSMSMGRAEWSAPEGIRTPNLLIRSQMLYPLSYGRIRCSVVARRAGVVAEARGFEPPVPVKGQLISSESHSAALARLLEPSLRGHRSFRTAGKEGYSSRRPDRKTAGSQRRLLSNQSKILVWESMSS